MGRRLYNWHFEFDRWTEDVGKFSVARSQGNYHTGPIINILRAGGGGAACHQGGGVESGKRLFYDLPSLMFPLPSLMLTLSIFNTVKVLNIYTSPILFLSQSHPLFAPRCCIHLSAGI